MNRILRRPMFRTGGSAEGITSGLAPRQGYATNEDNLVRPNDPSKYRSTRNFNDFLIGMGLDLVSRPKGGNIFQQVATSAKGPFKEFQAARAAGEERDWKMGLHKEQMDWKEKEFNESKRQFDLEMEQDRYLGELAAKGKNEFKKDMIDKVWDAKIADEKDTSKHVEMEKQRLLDIERYVIKGEDISDQYKILSNQSATYMAQGLAEDAILQATNQKTGLKWTKDDDGYAEALLKLYKKYLKITSEFLLEEERESDATGGRVGYQNAGAVGEGQNVLQGEGAAVQDETNQVNISYEQLRERLPQEISNEIVLLLAQSYEAFADFAEIQTQADVNEFNTKYNVQLFLPKQSGA